MDTQLPGNRDILIQIITAGKNRLVIYQKFGKTQFSRIKSRKIESLHRHHSLIRSQEDFSLGIANGSIEIELGTEQTILPIETAEGFRLRIKDRQSVVCGYPQHALIIFHNALDGIIRQSIIGSKRLHVGLTILIIVIAI